MSTQHPNLHLPHLPRSWGCILTPHLDHSFPSHAPADWTNVLSHLPFLNWDLKDPGSLLLVVAGNYGTAIFGLVHRAGRENTTSGWGKKVEKVARRSKQETIGSQRKRNRGRMAVPYPVALIIPAFRSGKARSMLGPGVLGSRRMFLCPLNVCLIFASASSQILIT